MPRLVTRSRQQRRATSPSRPGAIGSVTTSLALVLTMVAPSGAAVAEDVAAPSVPQGPVVAPAEPSRSQVSRSVTDEPAVQGVASVVLGHPDTLAERQVVAAAVDVAVGRVTAIWGPGWSRRVTVVLPDSQQEASDLVGPAVDLDRLAGVATADRVVLNPRTFLTLTPVGRNLVLTHEVMHLASRAATGPDTPLWLVEGLADYAGYLGLGVPLAVAAGQTAAALRRGAPVTALPSRADFDGVNPDLAASYEQAWLAVVRIAELYGQDRLIGLYRETGAAGSPAAAERAFATVLGTTRAAFEQEWAAHLTATLR